MKFTFNQKLIIIEHTHHLGQRSLFRGQGHPVHVPYLRKIFLFQQGQRSLLRGQGHPVHVPYLRKIFLFQQFPFIREKFLFSTVFDHIACRLPTG
jgi:hypothetical protein